MKYCANCDLPCKADSPCSKWEPGAGKWFDVDECKPSNKCVCVGMKDGGKLLTHVLLYDGKDFVKAANGVAVADLRLWMKLPGMNI